MKTARKHALGPKFKGANKNRAPHHSTRPGGHKLNHKLVQPFYTQTMRG